MTVGRKALWASLLLAVSLNAPQAWANSLPPDVVSAYRAYQTALESGDQVEASEKAYDAWQLAEDELGDHRTTGDLAQNYAMLDYRPTIKLSKRVEKAFDRSIELARLREDGVEIEVQRRIMKIDAMLNRPTARRYGLMGRVISVEGEEDMDALDRVIAEEGLATTTYAGESIALRSKYHWVKGEWEDAIRLADRAIPVLESATDDIVSAQPISVRVFKAQSQAQLGDRVGALLTYQDVVEVSRTAGAFDAMKGRLYPPMFRLQGELLLLGRLDEAVSRGYEPLELTDFPELKERPLVSVPPVMPSNARRSGWVSFKIDVDPSGTPNNIRVTDSSQRLFVKAAKKSITSWKYRPSADGTVRKDVDATITFILMDELGNRLPPKKPQPMD